MKIVYPAKVVKGEVKIVHRAQFNNDIQIFEGKEIIITVEKKKKKRSDSQNRFYWGGVLPIIKRALHDLGNIYTYEQIHEILKYKFLKVDEPIGEDGLFIERIKSTTELSTTEFMEYLQQITIWAAEFLGIEIPEPHEQQELNIE